MMNHFEKMKKLFEEMGVNIEVAERKSNKFIDVKDSAGVIRGEFNFNKDGGFMYIALDDLWN